MELFHRLPVVIADLLRQVRRNDPGASKPGGSGSTLLDVGCWDGEFTVAYAEALGAELKDTHALDFFPPLLETAARRGVKARQIDLETQTFPFPDESFDVVICNQVLEHLKQIYLPLSEIHRVLKEGGHAVISVPNLAALHNRLLLLAGRQPATIRIMGPHVRGYACRSFTEFLLHNGLFICEQMVPVGMYPFPVGIGSTLAALIPSLCHTPIWLLRKTSSKAPNWHQAMEQQKEQTNYFGNDRAS